MILVALIAILTHVIIELVMLKVYNSYLLSTTTVAFISSTVILLVGVIGGYFLGRTWWRIIYIEKRYKDCKCWWRK